MRRLIAVVVLAMFALAVPCVAQEAAPIADEVAEAAPWWIDGAAKAVEGLVALAIGAVFLLIRMRLKDDAAIKDAVSALEAGVQSAWDKFGRELKAGAKDGKFTEKERERLRDAAKAEALTLAKGPAKDLLFTWGRPYVTSLITRIVERRKRAA
jgi:hypothetical protein